MVAYCVCVYIKARHQPSDEPRLPIRDTLPEKPIIKLYVYHAHELKASRSSPEGNILTEYIQMTPAGETGLEYDDFPEPGLPLLNMA
jgi:hypothetical protein